MTTCKSKHIAYVDPDLKCIIPRFFKIRRNDIESIWSLLEAEDFSTIARIGHSMKGAGAGYGFDYVTTIGKEIEEAAKCNNKDGIRKWIGELEKYLDEIVIVYDE